MLPSAVTAWYRLISATMSPCVQCALSIVLDYKCATQHQPQHNQSELVDATEDEMPNLYVETTLHVFKPHFDPFNMLDLIGAS